MSKDKNIHEIDLNKYEDPDGLSLNKLKIGLWLSENREKMLKLVVIILILISAFFFVYSFYGYVIYFLTGSNKESDLAYLNSGVASQRNVVSDMLIGRPQVFRVGEKYDLAVSIKNPNEKFVAHFQYCFLNGGVNVTCSSGYILPSEEKYITALGQKISDIPAVSFKITDIFWQRVDIHKIPDWKLFAGERLNFGLENINLSLASENSLSDKIGLDSLDFSIENRTSYAYYEVPLSIALYRGSELVGVNNYIVKNFLAGEKRKIGLSWVGSLSNVTRTEIRPELDLLDDSIYLKYKGAQ